MNCVDWTESDTYCQWKGKRLPTEAEWERAARGGDGRLFPWGNEPATCARAVMDDGKRGCGVTETWPVVSMPDGQSPYGALHMAGNVFEWVSDWYDERAYATGPARNPSGPASGEMHAYRGGNWDTSVSAALRASRRYKGHSSYRTQYTGFRCAADGE